MACEEKCPKNDNYICCRDCEEEANCVSISRCPRDNQECGLSIED